LEISLSCATDVAQIQLLWSWSPYCHDCAELTSFSTGDIVDRLYRNHGRADLFHEAALELAEHKRRHARLSTAATHLSDPTTAHLSDPTTVAHLSDPTMAYLSDCGASLRRPQPLLRQR
jgi:hypothetical protein